MQERAPFVTFVEEIQYVLPLCMVHILSILLPCASRQSEVKKNGISDRITKIGHGGLS